MSTHITPRCPRCAYDLSGVGPSPQADPEGITPFRCPECGARVTMLAALNQREPDKHPILTAMMLAVLALAWFVIGTSCLTLIVLGLRSCTGAA